MKRRKRNTKSFNMKISIKSIVEPQLFFALFLLTLVFSLWLVAYLVGFDYAVEDNVSVFKNFFKEFGVNNFIFTLFVSFLLTIVNTILIQQINNAYFIIRTRTFLPILIFNILVAVGFRTHGLITAHIALTLSLLAVFFVFGMYRNKNAAEYAFLGSLFLALASFFVKPLLFLILIFWIGFFQLKSFSLRTFLASIIGLLLPWIFYFIFSLYFSSDYIWLTELFAGFEFSFRLFQQPLNEIIYLATMLAILLISLAGLYSNLQSDSIQTRANIMFLSMLSFGIFVLFMLFNQYSILLAPLFAFVMALLLSHPFSLRHNNFYGVLFIIFIFVNVVFALSNILFIPS